MLRVGLTGGIGSGKSTVGAMMAARGAHVIEADRIAHQLMSPGLDVYKDVVRHFGPSIVKADGTIDRKTLGKIAFAGRIHELNAVVHPAVIAYQQEWMARIGEREPHSVLVVEAALILEAGVGKRFDKLVMVTSPKELKVARYAHRVAAQRTMDEASARVEAEKRIAAQLPDADKLKVADFVIDNSGSLAATEEQVEKLMHQLKELAKAKA